ncbi:MAG: hypothetical protein M3525_07185, partial [Acidobacteriota bacterium]|nr:hypothetical protein [Acidobacteriota bacterium]
VQMSKELPQNGCSDCGETGRAVSRQTVVHHIKSVKLSSIGDEEYKFCSAPKCTVVYYAASGQTFTVDDTREPVTSKTEGDARPLCYCFGFTEGFARQQIARTGESSVSGQVSRFIKEKLCSCEIRNPSGVCCLGEVNKVIGRLLIESTAMQIPDGE